MRSLRYPHLGLVLVALALTVGMSGLLSGCGTGDDGSPRTYNNPTYGFSFDYPSDWQVATSGEADIAGGAEPVVAVKQRPGHLYGLVCDRRSTSRRRLLR